MAFPVLDRRASRHRLLEGFLLRLGARPDADAFVLRGGMRIRQWLPALGRPANDVDLVCRLPFDVADIRARLAEVFSDPRVADGVTFTSTRFRLDPIGLEQATPGLRGVASGRVDGRRAELRLDLIFGLGLWPPPRPRWLATRGGQVRLMMCEPETLIGRKLQVLAAAGPRCWRPKDLHDVRLLLRVAPGGTGVLGNAMEASFVGHDASIDDLRTILGGPPWWETPGSQARWRRFVRRSGDFAVPADLGGVVREVRFGLRRFLDTRQGRST